VKDRVRGRETRKLRKSFGLRTRNLTAAEKKKEHQCLELSGYYVEAITSKVLEEVMYGDFIPLSHFFADYGCEI